MYWLWILQRCWTHLLILVAFIYIPSDFLLNYVFCKYSVTNFFVVLLLFIHLFILALLHWLDLTMQCWLEMQKCISLSYSWIYREKYSVSITYDVSRRFFIDALYQIAEFFLLLLIKKLMMDFVKYFTVSIEMIIHSGHH